MRSGARDARGRHTLGYSGVRRINHDEPSGFCARVPVWSDRLINAFREFVGLEYRVLQTVRKKYVQVLFRMFFFFT